MPDFSLRWQNFRSFPDTGWLNIKPLTLLIGPNNSGKTSIFAPILLLKQTIESDDLSVQLKPKGDYFNAGSYKDLIYRHDIDLELGLNLRWLEQKSSDQTTLKSIGTYPPGSLELRFNYDTDLREIILKKYTVSDSYNRKILHRTRRSTGRYTLCGIKDFPDTVDDRVAHQEVIKSIPERFLFIPDDIIRSLLVNQEKTMAKKRGSSVRPTSISIKLSDALTMYLATIDTAYRITNQLLDHVSYIGPLRERPSRLYDLSDEKPSSVGIRGQFAPEILFRSQDESFENAVNHWIKEFEFGSKIRARPLIESAFTLELSRRGQEYKTNFADTGFGMSQIFPIIISGHHVGRNSFLIFEQPEIHLNPRLQALLADLFVEFVRLKRSVLVETHSEHLLLRLRKLVAEGKIDSDDVALYYVEKAGNQSSVRTVPIQKNGHIDPKEWPKGFFDESLREALGLASSQARRAAGAG